MPIGAHFEESRHGLREAKLELTLQIPREESAVHRHECDGGVERAGAVVVDDDFDIGVFDNDIVSATEEGRGGLQFERDVVGRVVCVVDDEHGPGILLPQLTHCVRDPA